MERYIVAGPKPGAVMFTDSDGVILREVALPPGVYSVASLRKMAAPGELVAFEHPPVRQVGNSRTCKPVGQFDSAANPHFRMTAAARQARDLRAMLARNAALEAGIRKGVQALRRSAKAVPQIEHTPGPLGGDEGAGAGEVSAT